MCMDTRISAPIYGKVRVRAWWPTCSCINTSTLFSPLSPICIVNFLRVWRHHGIGQISDQLIDLGVFIKLNAHVSIDFTSPTRGARLGIYREFSRFYFLQSLQLRGESCVFRFLPTLCRVSERYSLAVRKSRWETIAMNRRLPIADHLIFQNCRTSLPRCSWSVHSLPFKATLGARKLSEIESTALDAATGRNGTGNGGLIREWWAARSDSLSHSFPGLLAPFPSATSASSPSCSRLALPSIDHTRLLIRTYVHSPYRVCGLGGFPRTGPGGVLSSLKTRQSV